MGTEPAKGRVAPEVDAENYAALLTQAKAAVRSARLQAHLMVSAELLGLYWRLGKLVLDRQKAEGWGTEVIDRLSADLHAEFPQMKGCHVPTRTTCERSRLHGLTFRNKLLHNCRWASL